MLKRLYLILLLLLAVVAPMSAVLTVDNTEPISDNNRVIYELNLYDFTSQGTLAAAQQRLPELRRLGIDIIWLMPLHPRGEVGKIGALGSPYAVRDYKAVNPDHGTLANLQSFVSTAHNLGMKVWLDWVPNHTAKDHAWVYSHPEYYHRVNGVIQSPPAFGDVYQLDFRASSGLADAMIDAMRYWVNQADIDGIAIEVIENLRLSNLLSIIQQRHATKSEIHDREWCNIIAQNGHIIIAEIIANVVMIGDISHAAH